jgi:hypothetical protein
MDIDQMTDAQVDEEFAKQEAAMAQPVQSQPVTAGEAVATPEPAQERGLLLDMALGAVHGVESAIKGVREDARAIERMLPESMQDEGINEPLTMGTPAPQTTIGKLESDVIRFGAGFLGAGKFIKGAGMVAGAAKSLISTVVTSDPNADRLSNLIEEHPYLHNSVSEYLQAQPGDSFAEGKFKAAIEDLGLSAVGGLLYKSIKAAKSHFTGTGLPDHEMANAVRSKGFDDTSHIPPGFQAGNVFADSVERTGGFKMSDAGKTKVMELLQEQATASVGAEQVAGKAFVNVKHLTGSDNMKESIEKFGAILGPEMKANGWTEAMTHAETIKAAELLESTPEIVLGSLRALGTEAKDIGPRLLAGRTILTAQAKHLSDMVASSRLTGQGGDEALKYFDTFIGTLSDVKMSQLTMARGLESMKIATPVNVDRLSNFIKGAGSKQNALDQIAMTGGDSNKLAKLASGLDKVGAKAGSVIGNHNTYFINAILSSPTTHIVNAASTAANTLLQPLNLVVGGTIKRDWADVREGLAMYQGIKTHLMDSFEMSWKSLQTELPVLGGGRTIEADLAMNGGSMWAKAIRIPTRLLGASDEFFKQVNYRSKVSAQVAREAADEVRSGRMTADQVESFVKTKFQAAFDKNGAALSEDALKYADNATFTKELDVPTWLDARSFGETFSGIAGNHPILRGTILPFVRTPVNLMRQVIDYTPVVGQLRRQFWEDIQAGGTRQTEALGRVSVGSGMFAGAAMLAHEGKLTGAAPRDKELSDQLKATGWQPYSFVLNNSDGTKTYISYARLDPFSAVLGIVADYAQTHAHIQEKERDSFAAQVSLSLANNLMSKSYLKGLTEIITGLASEDSERMQVILRNRIASYIPGATKVLQPDTGLKEMRGLMDGLMSKIPGLSGMLEPKRDLFGAKRMPPVGYPQSAFNPFPVTTSVKDPVVQELARLSQGDGQAQFAMPNETVGNIDLSTIRNKQGRSAYDYWTEKSGVGLKDALLARMQSPGYVNGTDGNSWYTAGNRVSMVRDVIQSHRDRAMRDVQEAYPELRESMRKDRENKMSIRHGRDAKHSMTDLLNFGKE